MLDSPILNKPAPVSVITLTHNREDSLHHMIQGLRRCGDMVQELIIVRMGEDAQDIDAPDLTIRQHHVPRVDGRLPLAHARNMGASLASQEALLFLDVDCIPSAGLPSGMAHHLARHDGLIMGEVRYLPRGFDAHPDSLAKQGQAHPIRPVVDLGTYMPMDDYGMFWSLCFMCTRQSYDRIGGFDEGYVGYGGEDTDFAFRTRALGVPFGLSGHIAYHQYHDVYRPPLNHLVDIVENATRFHQRWDHWPMAGWLGEFAQDGWIRWDGQEQEVQILRYPDADDIEATKCRQGVGY